MKSLIIIMTAFMLTSASCEKNNEAVIKGNNEEGVIKGKLVYRSCASTVVQVLNTAFYSIAQNEWKQSPSRPTYEHVFAVSNPCSFPNYTEGQEFTFQIITNDPKNADCVVCMMFDNPPTRQNMIRVLNKAN